MKTRTFFILLLLVMVTLSIGTWVYFSSKDSLGPADFMHFSIVIVLVVLALIFGIRRLRSERRGEPAEDEFSKKIMQRAASTSYYLSLYWWLGLVYLSENWEKETESIIGIGILGMAILFAICWIFYKVKGIRS